MEDMMKYVTTWQTRQNASEESQARGLQVFSKWTPPENVTFHEFLGRADGRGGFAVIETDDVMAAANINAVFGAFFDITMYPVVEIQDSARAGGEAVEFRSSV
jgi:hypothetical protein